MTTLSSGVSRLDSSVKAINTSMGDVAKKADLDENRRRFEAALEQKLKEELEEMMTRQQEQREAEQQSDNET